MQVIDIYPAIIEACDFCDEFSRVSVLEDEFVVCPNCLRFICEKIRTQTPVRNKTK